MFSTEPPTIVLHPPPNVLVQANTTLQLVCAATGVPSPMVVWSDTSGNITNGTIFQVLSSEEEVNRLSLVTTVLKVCSVRIADAGEYHCTTGNSSVTVNVGVQGKKKHDLFNYK